MGIIVYIKSIQPGYVLFGNLSYKAFGYGSSGMLAAAVPRPLLTGANPDNPVFIGYKKVKIRNIRKAFGSKINTFS